MPFDHQRCSRGRRLRGSLDLSRLMLRALLILTFFAFIASAQSQKVQDDLERASQLIRSNHFAEAEQQLNSVLRALPNNVTALNLLGTIRAQQGKLNEAESLLTRAAKLDPQSASAHMNLAFLFMLKHAPEKAVAELKEVVKLEPENVEANYKLARLLLSRGQTDESIIVCETAKSITSASGIFLPLLGDAYLRKGNAEQAEENYRSALAAQPNNVEALLGMAKISQSRADLKTATDYVARARELAGNSADISYKVGATAMSLGLFEQAQPALEQAVKLSPREPAYLIALGAAWLKKADLFTAEGIFRQAIAAQPDNAQAQMYLGYVLYKQKKYAEAKGYLEQSLKSDAQISESAYYLGVILQEENEDERANVLLERAIQISPSFANAHIALGAGYLKLKDYRRAQTELELGVKLNPDDSKGHYQLALLYARLKDPQRAQAEMQIVEKLKAAEQSQKKEGDTFVIAPPNSL